MMEETEIIPKAAALMQACVWARVGRHGPGPAEMVTVYKTAK